MDTNRENDIIARVRKGERDLFARLVEQYKGPVYNLAYRLTGSRTAAEELAQESFLRAYQKLDHFDSEKKFFPWLYTISLNIIRNHLKKHREGISDYGQKPEIPDNSNSPEQNLADRQLAKRLDFLLQRLSMEHREALVLRFYQDLAFEELAAVLDISLSAAKMRVYRGLEQLRQSIRKPGTEDF